MTSSTSKVSSFGVITAVCGDLCSLLAMHTSISAQACSPVRKRSSVQSHFAIHLPHAFSDVEYLTWCISRAASRNSLATSCSSSSTLVSSSSDGLCCNSKRLNRLLRKPPRRQILTSQPSFKAAKKRPVLLRASWCARRRRAARRSHVPPR